MQNKNRVLKRGGFAVIAAVFMMLLITLMLLKMLSYSTDISARTTDNYLNEQAQLLAFNATEDAVYRISGRDASSSCETAYTDTYPSDGTAMFNISVNIQYVWAGAAPSGTNCNNTFTTVTTPEQNGSALIDVYVTSHANLNLDEPIRIHRRTLQKL
jgi:Tfp pilus assembly protein PilX